jgi:uncharacterized membrane protein
MSEKKTDNSYLEQDTDNNDEPVVTWSNQKWWSKGLTIFLLLAIIICIGATIYIINTGHSSDPFTEFYILGKDGKADNYPAKLKPNEKAEVKLGIVNHEYSQTIYRVDISINGTNLKKIGPITLDDEQKWEDLINFSITTAGASQKVDFLLYKQTESKPYLKLNLIVDVNE